MLAYQTETPEVSQEPCLWCDRTSHVEYIHYPLASGNPSSNVEPMCEPCQRTYKEGSYKDRS